MQDVIGLATRKASLRFLLPSDQNGSGIGVRNRFHGTGAEFCFRFARVRVLRGGRSPAGGA